MNAKIKNKLVDAINEQWKDNNELKIISIILLVYITRTNPKQLAHLTYSSLHRIAGLGYLRKDLVLAVDYLSKDEIGVLKCHLEYIGEESDLPCPIPIEKDEETGDLIHSETGEIIRNMFNVFPYFTLTDKAKSINIYS